VSSNDSRRSDRSDRARRRLAPGEAGLEALETRELLAFSPLGFSLPDLTVSGYAAPVAAWGNSMAVTVDVRNVGSSSMYDPLRLAPGTGSTADAGPSKISVFISRRPRGGEALKIGTFAVPAVVQNGLVEETALVALPQQPRGFPGNGGTIYVSFEVDQTQQVADRNRLNNTSGRVPVQIAVALPDLFGIALDVPPVMQPGDVIQPNIKVANYGTVDTAPQGPFEVDLVASTQPFFGPGSQVVSRFQVSSLPPLADVPSQNTVLGDVNVQNPLNVIQLEGAPVALPTSPTGYFLGVIIDPQHKIRQIHEIGNGFSSALSPVVKVGNPIAGLPPAGVGTTPVSSENLFPIPPGGPVQSIQGGSDNATDIPAPNASSSDPSFVFQAIKNPGSRSRIPQSGSTKPGGPGSGSGRG
jgi:hypothetical protein